MKLIVGIYPDADDRLKLIHQDLNDFRAEHAEFAVTATQKLDRIDVTTRDTNERVMEVTKTLAAVAAEIESLSDQELFATKREERQFDRNLEELVESLPATAHPGDSWYDQDTKKKIKLALSIPLIPGLVAAKWEQELDVSSMQRPRRWAEFKRWFIKQ